MPDINGIPYVESTDLVSGWPTISQSVAQEVSDQLAEKVPYAYGTATPSTTVDGFVWFDENDTPPTPKFWDGSAFQNVAPAGGFDLITSQSFSAVSSVSVNNCFSATYEAYRFLLYGASSAAQNVNFRLRVGGVDDSTANAYVTQIVQGTSSTASAAQISDSFGVLTYQNTNMAVGTGDILRPAVASPTFLIVNGGRNPSTIYTLTSSIYHNQSTAYDGITILAGAGTLTGTLKIYGYKD